MRWKQSSFDDHGLELSCTICNRKLVLSDNDQHADASYTPYVDEENYDEILSHFQVESASDISVCHNCLTPHIDNCGVDAAGPFAVTFGIPEFGEGKEPLAYDEACHRYHTWAQEQAQIEGHYFAVTPQPNAGLSDEIDGVWHLQNVNGPLAKVDPNGVVTCWEDDE